MSAISEIGEVELEKTKWIDVIILWFVGVFAAMQFAKLSISYDQLLIIYNVDSSSMGIMLSVVGFIGLLFGVVAGVLSGYIGYQKVLIGSLLIGGLLSFIQSMLPSYYLLLTTRVIEGLSHLGLIVAAPTLMLRSSTQNHHSLVMGLWGTFFGVAFAITGWLGGEILIIYGVSGIFIAHAFLSLPLVFYFLFSSKLITANESGCNKLNFLSLLNQTVQVYLNPRTFLPGLIFLFHTTMFVALLTFIPRLASNNSEKNLLFILLPLCSIAGTFLSGFLSQYLLRPQNLIFIAYVGVTLMAYFVISFEGFSLFFLFSALLLLVISGVVQGASFALIPALSKTESEQAMGNGSIAQLGNLGATIGSPIFAYAIDLNGSQGLFFVLMGLCIAGCIVALISRRY
ncbi:MFS transporter [Marinomonas aquiplantarum]|uniref:Putative MFS family arabinose efflux permease n=1 Tax=Marinomonas aquiplantarum TaxID=491951 RepID=A0A366CXJ9_9GAMM|nr:MFS transporter [Marinomonas aquiplantarum]RBO80191.1 putative MFS family arabinose efflux permease [Marinomonas aquiplantarum]